MKYTVYNEYNFRSIPQLQKVDEYKKFEIEVLSKIQPFRTNNYVVNELIDWEDFENDPMYIMNFPVKQMMRNSYFEIIAELLKKNASKDIIRAFTTGIWNELNPHPAGQMSLNVPVMDGEKLTGLQHKYRETVLFFPMQGQTCHAYCTFCFRWPQFVGISQLKFVMKESGLLISYLKKNKQVTDLLITGGDPMIMSSKHLSEYINAILDANISHLKTIRIGTKSLSYWPYRYVSDPDSKEILKLFRKVTKAGKQLAIMSHFSHPVELSTDIVHRAIDNIKKTGAQIRSQSPVLNHINANPNIWAKLWKDLVSLGIIPYYMFIPRDTGAQKYFGVPLQQAYQIFRDAYSHVSGLCRTVRGPIMSCGPGKIQIAGISEINGEKVFILNFVQARNSRWTGRPFFARYNEMACWLNDLKPAFSQKEFFFENQYNKIIDEKLNVQQINSEEFNAYSMCS
jgi:KamA family protein